MTLMDLGTILAIVGVVLAVSSAVVERHSRTLLVIGVVLVGLAVLVGVEPIVTSRA